MFGNISQLLEMKKKAEELKGKLAAITITESHKGITIDCDGNKKIKSIHIESSLMNDKMQLEDILTEAINKAIESADRSSMGHMSELAGQFPGIGNLFGK